MSLSEPTTTIVGDASSPDHASIWAKTRWQSFANSRCLSALLIVEFRIVVGLGAAYIALKTVPHGPFFRSDLTAYASSSSLIDNFLRWDSAFYLTIAHVGYSPAAVARSPFFPAYPALIWLAAHVGLGYDTGAVVISWIALFFATWAVVELADALIPGPSSHRCGYLLAWAPTSVFLVAGYADCLYVALVAWALLFMVRNRHFLAAAMAALASASRPEGCVIGVALALALVLQRQYLKAAALVVVGELGFLGFSAFCWVNYGSPIEYLRAQSSWGRVWTVPFYAVWSTFAHLTSLDGNALGVLLVDAVAIVVASLATIYLGRLALRQRELWSLVAFCALSLVPIACTATPPDAAQSAARLVMCMVPLYLLVARIRWGPVWSVLLCSSVALALILQAVFNTGWWLT